MQKISSYLYPNRISVVADLASYPTEWRIVYQRMIKLYQGMHNVIELDIKNSEQRRIPITDYTLKCVIMDQLGNEIYTATVVPIPQTTGLATITVPAEALDRIKPQFLNYSVYILNQNGTKTPIYGDTSFGAIGKIDLIAGAVPGPQSPKIIDTFTYLVNDDYNLNAIDRTYYSESVEVNPQNDIGETAKIDLEFRNKNLNAEVKVQLTSDQVVSAGTRWETLDTFIIDSSTTLLEKSYTEIHDFSNNISWLRITYDPINQSTGTFDKILVRM